MFGVCSISWFSCLVCVWRVFDFSCFVFGVCLGRVQFRDFRVWGVFEACSIFWFSCLGCVWGVFDFVIFVFGMRRFVF